MSTSLSLTADARALVLACTDLGLDGDRSLTPLGTKDWHELRTALSQSRWERPRELLGRAADELHAELRIARSSAERLARLFARGSVVERELDRLAEHGIWVLTREDESYPAALIEHLDTQAPPVLYGAGPISGLALQSVAVVGSRRADDRAVAWARRFGRRCAATGYAVLSGASRGVDLAAIVGALEGEGKAIGITADPLERLVTRRDLRGPLQDGVLTLITPFHPAARWHADNAMRRSRLIFALAGAAVVVATAPSGGRTHQSAIEDLEAGWTPLHVREDGTPGNEALLKAGGIRIPAGDPARLDIAAIVGPAFRAPQPVAPVASILAPAAVAAATVAPPLPGPVPVVAVAPAPVAPERPLVGDAFPLLWPALAALLTTPRQEREVADQLRLELTQARAWLKRAVAEGRAEMVPRPNRYMLPGVREQAGLGA